jgi:hypothetical protein
VRNAAVDVAAMDGLGIIGTLGFVVPAALLVGFVVGAVVRDRRLHAREERLAQDPAADEPTGTTGVPRVD